ncbi:Sec-independent protein translocase subunit TatA [Glaciecola sp. KUL10]|jgi:sec-independent protein translocase protein TatA|uniref:Sec-independent protein translocase subunit TatA n=1 Tax=Glaciecola sp. (strain KUL10) TaxID=2161813 RepID=UPI000D781CCE|nr:Sec-independent protein translocase subunit TatA [Glaciecola sp. KUL10]GBL03809.1 hypothetical protein KUL10_11090 [Glaciecola sp. KUL10]
MGGISIWQILIILVIVILLFGTKKLRNVGTDLGGALKGFKKAMSEEDSKNEKDADFEAVEEKVVEPPLKQKDTAQQTSTKD